ncbi:30S ribosomal protein S17 [Syntrophus aciditrophicus]|uniref:Small ribosomal subunit protein uS17 n=1 Tax=Syntrophus aciditrophicus (strain SB) TaxID=56780 RepID=RS17_SYNAS|nr:30S ribosomal protein S17 [Syntrophus aciditrophicus]Q2LQB1.1 RecName: Full=Small ribosomal subunit protein uS17; AltName: Full=30S ribosomal protein S17 [Syntrophus aciditrophicus SB]ABC76190.1 SSU ribosomal protein S17P [Syntrophus aciditrophicus SB]OPY17615.1 MAG: 30S ribosomal protein S17 [Syntrophus sp. PtaB.Bin075]
MSERGFNRTIKGVVVSNKMDKTIVIRAERLVKHPVFHKYTRKHVKYMVHDEKNECKVGDTVIVMESRPLSRLKRWRMLRIVAKAE